MQLSSRILTALAVLILAVAVVAVRAGSTGTVEAATGTIDVLNVGTCYATDIDVFKVGACDDGDGNAYDVADRDTISEVGTVYATYAHDPKTAPDDPRGILTNSNVIKISIADSGRDKRIPVLLGAGNSKPCDGTDPGCSEDYQIDDDANTTNVDESANGHLKIIQKDYPGVMAETDDFRWTRRGAARTAAFDVDNDDPRVITGITIDRGTGVGTPPVFNPYKPMFVVDGDDSPISLYGLFDKDGQFETTTDDQEFMKLNKYLAIDEDVGSGRVEGEGGAGNAEVAPWFSVQTSIDANAAVRVMYVVYETSEREVLIGGQKEAGYTDETTPKFTKSETKDDSALVVEARSDGRASSQNLQLKETSRFSGRYEGYLRLTDENGNDPTNGASTNWGLAVGPATGTDMASAATLGVESGPVNIAYKDTDGSTKQLAIMIDTVSPSVAIDSPAHNSEGQDTSPEFSGAFSDGESGLRKDSFRLYVDHTDDTNENGVKGTAALDLRVDGSDSTNPYGIVAAAGGSDAVVESRRDYSGYASASQFGVIGHGDVFDLDTTANDPKDELKSVEGDNHDDGATNGTFGDSIRIDFPLPAGSDNFNNTIDFQALVADRAGNIGFSDSDNEGPRFINHLGEEKKKRKTDKYNVLGWFARHVFFLDETDPAIFKEQTVTGFYGENDDNVPQVSRNGILVAFDRAVDADSIGVDTFSVTLDPPAEPAGATGAAATIVDVDVQGRLVYLMLEDELASDATPKVDIVSGQWVSDPAGNRLTGGDVSPFEANDGISPVITVSLSGGSGTGEGSEGPSSLTRNSIVVTIEADEEINATPSLVVVCSNIGYDSDDKDTENDKELSDLIKSRSGGLKDRASANFSDLDDYNCGSDTKAVSLQQVQSYSRPGLAWEYQWVNFTDDKALTDGKLTVVAYARDRRSYRSPSTRAITADELADDTYNWGAGTAEFRYDTTLLDPATTPGDGDTVTETRPFVLLTYTDKTTVSIDELKVDGTVQEAQVLGGNRFLYWPEELSIGSHAVVIDAVDAAGNKDTYEYSFKAAERTPFNLKLIAGWNAVSFPANPVDPAISSVFTEDVVDMVAGWDISDPTKPWSIASRVDGEWSTHNDFATLDKVSARYGYWVHTQGFVTQKVALIGQINRLDAGVVPPDLVSIPTEPGWNFVGVIDQDGDQTQASFGTTLKTGDDTVNAGAYLGANAKAYTWDAIRSRFDVLESGDSVTIGDGIWVYYGGGIAP